MAHIRQAAKSGDPSALLIMEQLQNTAGMPSLFYLFNWFIELSNGRTYNIGGPNPLAFTEIEAWKRLTDRLVDPWEVAVFKRLDSIWLEVVCNDPRPSPTESGNKESGDARGSTGTPWTGNGRAQR